MGNNGQYFNRYILEPVCGPRVKYMSYAYYRTNLYCNNLVCGDNVIDFSHAYHMAISRNGPIAPVLGDNVINMSHSYSGFGNLTGEPICENKVEDMSNAYAYTNIYGTPVCGPNVINMDATYYNCKILTGPPVCGPNVINMCNTYALCENLAGNAVCGPNVVDMTNAYYNCFKLNGAPVCGPNVVNMSGAYFGCNNIIGTAVIGEKVENLENAYFRCYNLTTLTYSDNVKNYVNTYASTRGGGEWYVNKFRENIIVGAQEYNNGSWVFNNNNFSYDTEWVMNIFANRTLFPPTYRLNIHVIRYSWWEAALGIVSGLAWTNLGENCFYNAAANIYVYNNYKDSELREYIVNDNALFIPHPNFCNYNTWAIRNISFVFNYVPNRSNLMPKFDQASAWYWTQWAYNDDNLPPHIISEQGFPYIGTHAFNNNKTLVFYVDGPEGKIKLGKYGISGYPLGHRPSFNNINVEEFMNHFEPKDPNSYAYFFMNWKNFNNKCLTYLHNNITNIAYIFQNCYGASLGYDAWCGPNVINMSHAYDNCFQFWLSGNKSGLMRAACGDKVTDLSYAYNGCPVINSVCGPNVINMNHAYAYSNAAYLAIGEKVEDLSYAYYQTNLLATAPYLPPNVKNIEWAFFNSKGITGTALCPDYIDSLAGTYGHTNIDTAVCGPNVVNMRSAYTHTKVSIPVCGDKVENMMHAYSGCYSITEPICGPNVTDMSYAYQGCNALKNFVCGEKVINMMYTYANARCDDLVTPIFGNNVEDASYAYHNLVVPYNNFENRTIVCPNSIQNLLRTFAANKIFNYKNCNFFLPSNAKVWGTFENVYLYDCNFVFASEVDIADPSIMFYNNVQMAQNCSFYFTKSININKLPASYDEPDILNYIQKFFYLPIVLIGVFLLLIEATIVDYMV